MAAVVGREDGKLFLSDKSDGLTGQAKTNDFFSAFAELPGSRSPFQPPG
jgi:hypothetical protein